MYCAVLYVTTFQIKQCKYNYCDRNGLVTFLNVRISRSRSQNDFWSFELSDFSLLDIKDKDTVMRCSWFVAVKTLNTTTSNSNILKHFSKLDTSTKLVVKALGDANSNDTTLPLTKPLHPNSHSLIDELLLHSLQC